MSCHSEKGLSLKDKQTFDTMFLNRLICKIFLVLCKFVLVKYAVFTVGISQVFLVVSLYCIMLILHKDYSSTARAVLARKSHRFVEKIY